MGSTSTSFAIFIVYLSSHLLNVLYTTVVNINKKNIYTNNISNSHNNQILL